jgi:uncharacterized membrane protein YraQ (UPF0718 family)
MKNRKSIPADLVFLSVVSCAAIALLLVFPEKQEKVFATSREFFLEMALILPAVMVLVGLFSVFIPKELVGKYLSKEAGLKGVFAAMVMGSLPTGPLYVAFPIASALLKKGARISNVTVFLTAWSCIKLPQELIELEFLGVNFMVARLVLTAIFATLMGFLLEQIISSAKSNFETQSF